MIDATQDAVWANTHFHVSAADVTAANRKHMRWAARRGRTWVFLLGFATICTIVVAITTPGGWTPIVMAASAAGGLSWMIVWSLIVYAAMPLFARRAMKTQPNLLHEWRVDLSERGMRAVTPNQDNFVAWADYVAWSEALPGRPTVPDDPEARDRAGLHRCVPSPRRAHAETVEATTSVAPALRA